MGSVNKVIVVGNLGRDAEVRFTQAGQAVANFSVAATETWKDKDGQKQEKTEWVRVVLWGKAAEALKAYLLKGKQVFVEGRLQTRQWEKDGVKRYTTEVNAQSVVLLGGRPGARDESPDEVEEPAGREPMDPVASVSAINDDDIPF